MVFFHIWPPAHIQTSKHSLATTTRRVFLCPLTYKSCAPQRSGLSSWWCCPCWSVSEERAPTASWFFRAEGLSRVVNRGQENRRLLRCNSCPCGTVQYLVHCKAWGPLGKGPLPRLIPLHHSIILQYLHLSSGSIYRSLFTDVKPFRQICLRDICQILSYRNHELSRS